MRALTTLLGAAAAGFLIWLAAQLNDHSTGGYWAVYGIVAGAGVVLGLSQLAGRSERAPRAVFLLGFLPVLIVAGWIAIAVEPHGNWFRRHALSWSGDMHIRHAVRDLGDYVAVLAFGTGLVFGFSFPGARRRKPVAGAAAVPPEQRAADEPPAPEHDDEVADQPESTDASVTGAEHENRSQT